MVKTIDLKDADTFTKKVYAIFQYAFGKKGSIVFLLYLIKIILEYVQYDLLKWSLIGMIITLNYNVQKLKRNKLYSHIDSLKKALDIMTNYAQMIDTIFNLLQKGVPYEKIIELYNSKTEIMKRSEAIQFRNKLDSIIKEIDKEKNEDADPFSIQNIKEVFGV